MAVLERSELESSPLADLHAIADQIGLDGFRRLRKADLIDAILGESTGESAAENGGERAEQSGGESVDETPSGPAAGDDEQDERPARPRRRRGGRMRRRPEGEESDEPGEEPREESREEPREEVREEPARRPRARGGEARERTAERTAEGVVEVLGNGSAFLRVDPPEPSDDDVYISAAQVRRCELVSGDRVTGPVRTPRRSERYPSLVRIDTINGSSADEISDGARYEDLPVAWPSERLALESGDQTLQAIEWLTPIGKGSRATIIGARHAGKSQTLRRIAEALHGREGLELVLVLAGARPEEIAEWQDGPVAPAAALSFAASGDALSQAVERALDGAKRIASRGGDAVVLIDSLDGLHQQAARRALAAARNLRDSGSLTVIATAAEPLGGETTVISLDAALTAAGRQPILDLVASSTLRPELLVGADGAEAIAKARASALDGS
ncbi:MAG TPA: Rho termination factor N-terminal domain-containing protein [Solirubrobacteraceae bacterium]